MVRRDLGLNLVWAVLALLPLAGCTTKEAPLPVSPAKETTMAPAPESEVYNRPTPDELRTKLTPEQFRVTQEEGTERPFQNPYWNQKEPGLYVDVVTGEPLFSSTHKFDSGTGWPSFTRPVEPGRVEERRDESHGMLRVEVRSRTGDSHLGHLFPDGPQEAGGLRYCINSASLRFVPVDRLEAEGYGRFLPLFGRTGEGGGTGGSGKVEPQQRAVAVLAGGCFWGMEEILRKIPGVLDTEVGYAGGTGPGNYEAVSSGKTGHAEAVQVTYDPSKLSYEALLGYFFRMHDPTTPNRQGNDVGTQYRSALFVFDDLQRKAAEKVKAELDRSGKWKRPVVTEIVSAGKFYPAETYHQDYLVKNPGGYTCHYLRD